ncbi:hypothetical protein [Streptomyces purpurogeneiscleroticus]|uniref:hypothetical protein n=1 Tax=Streptomyces purpurogeneiscleroticus TaxID=68259 RepID=UPI001CBDFBE7|nr:hypothetical protein [Streptomyces purpurogeneiscleroticus]MBZ4018671.1 hypothetical protein [Streptomyces purpurogeneiscleroticus]
MAARSSSIVTALTVAALAAVGFLAFQASADATGELVPVRSAKGGPVASPAPSGHPAPKESAKEKERRRTAVPAHSGTGQRVVYALDARRVWLVGPKNQVLRTYEVVPSAVSPAPGAYTVTTRSASVTGSDGIPIENVVRFATVDNVVVGFSAAVDGSMPQPGTQQKQKTGGIREKRADGAAMWKFATIGKKVVVVP